MSSLNHLSAPELLIEVTAGRNVVDEDNNFARGLELELNRADGSLDQKMQIAVEIVRKLDQNCHHINKQVYVSGKVLTKEVALKDIKFLNKDEVLVDQETPINYVERTVDDSFAYSRGYIAVYHPFYEHFIVYVVVEMPFYEIDIPGHGVNISQSGIAYVPIDGSSHITIADHEQSNIPNVEMLDVYAPDILDAIDEMFEEVPLEPENLNHLLETLGKLDLATLQTGVFSRGYEEIREHIGEYITALLPRKASVPYHVSGTSVALVSFDGENQHEIAVPKDQMAPGFIHRVIVNHTLSALAIELITPFSDDNLYPVQYKLDEHLKLFPFDTFPIEQTTGI